MCFVHKMTRSSKMIKLIFGKGSVNLAIIEAKKMTRKARQKVSNLAIWQVSLWLSILSIFLE